MTNSLSQHVNYIKKDTSFEQMKPFLKKVYGQQQAMPAETNTLSIKEGPCQDDKVCIY